MVKWLIENGINIDVQNKNSAETCLHCVCGLDAYNEDAKFQVALFLVKHCPVLITRKDKDGYFPVSRAIENKLFNLALMLMQKGSPWRLEDVTSQISSKVMDFIQDLINIPKYLKQYFKVPLARKIIFEFICGQIENEEVAFNYMMNFSRVAMQ